MDSGHEALDDLEVVVDDLGERGEAVGRARRVGDDRVLRVVRLVVDAHDVHRGVGRRGGDDDLLGAALEVSAGLVDRGEDAGRLDDVRGAVGSPRNVGRVALAEDFDLVPW